MKTQEFTTTMAQNKSFAHDHNQDHIRTDLIHCLDVCTKLQQKINGRHCITFGCQVQGRVVGLLKITNDARTWTKFKIKFDWRTLLPK